ncbi:MAG: RrF2 family transcriptional regulator [Bilifractor sp.]
MLITRETDYALRILRALSDSERHNMKDLCQQEAVPQQFAYKILRKLSDAGLIQTVRGVNGGVQLCNDLRNLSLLDLMHITESDNAISDCMKAGYPCTWAKKNCSVCTIHTRLLEIQHKLDEEMRKVILHDLLCMDAAGNSIRTREQEN